jgi:hypothetical protein
MGRWVCPPPTPLSSPKPPHSQVLLLQLHQLGLLLGSCVLLLQLLLLLLLLGEGQLGLVLLVQAVHLVL